MRALIEGIGALFGMPVSEGKARGYRITIVLVMIGALMIAVWLAGPA